MSRGSKIWLAVAAAFTLLNLGGVVFAAAERELVHALTHCGLVIAGGVWMWYIAGRARRPQAQPEAVRARIDYLQQSVDAMALEVERIGEAQRFNDKLRAEAGADAPPQGTPR